MKVDYHQVNWISFFRERGLVPTKKRQRKKAGAEIVNVVAAFDIETSTIRKPGAEAADTTAYSSFMYIWMWQIEDYLIKGRTWDDWLECLGVIRSALQEYGREKKLAVTPIMVSYIHNASFEFAFISGIYPFTEKDCFFRDERKPLYFRMYNAFEFRCSYMQSNLSLKALTKKCGVKEKLSGQKYDYNKVRFPWTELTPFEDEYTTIDVESLVACMKYRLEKNDDTLHTIPLTSTGYVRRECKESLKNYYLDIMDMKPWRCEEKDGEKVGEIEIYKLLRQAFRGGNTHANRFLVNKVLPRTKDAVDGIYSYDIASSYPTQQLTHKFPMGPFKWIDKPDFKKVAYYIGLGYAVVGTYGFKDIRLKNPREPMPYISLSRCEAETGFKLDNGRILSAPYIKISCTEIDLEIILDQYTFTGTADVKQAMIAKKDYLFREYRKVILDYYEKKTSLKGDDTEDGLYMYTKSKNMLNAIYGMSATDPIHQTIKYIAGTEEAIEKGSDYKTTSYDTMTAKEVQDALRGAAFPYQWGVYRNTTAYARKQLQDAIKLCGDKIVYCDTDSVKTLGPVPIEKLNDELKKAAIRAGAYADDMHGNRHYIGLFEEDAFYTKFITQGAKRYAYVKGEKMGVTCAGVTKTINEETGVPFAVEELRCLKRFKPGMIWRKAGGTMAVYNDNDDYDYTDPETGKSIHIGKNVAIVPTTYKMTYSRDYAALLNEISLYAEYKEERS